MFNIFPNNQYEADHIAEYSTLLNQCDLSCPHDLVDLKKNYCASLIVMFELYLKNYSWLYYFLVLELYLHSLGFHSGLVFYFSVHIIYKLMFCYYNPILTYSNLFFRADKVQRRIGKLGPKALVYHMGKLSYLWNTNV